MTKQTSIRSLAAPVFDILFPQSQNFQSHLHPDVDHCLMRVLSHINDRPMNTSPSTKDGVLIHFDVKVG